MEIQLAPASILMQGCEIVAGAVTQANNNVTKGEVAHLELVYYDALQRNFLFFDSQSSFCGINFHQDLF